MTDFFINYTSADSQWAEWIAYVLEERSFKTIIQAWYFIPGSNFVLEMQRATSQADRTVLVLSPDYLRSGMASSEWARAFNRDPEGLERKLLPVMVRRCEPDGLLASIVQVRIDAMDEDAARDAVLASASRARAKPSGPPPFPGHPPVPDRRQFPGAGRPPERRNKTVLPKVRTPLTVPTAEGFPKRLSSRSGASLVRTWMRR
ncbi:toll/interleukin-1 receptor domain-containing protein [Bosea sp. WAO]|uniref:toll/interleukin-1 receptor domain-containing protein n=1 Tax=Bosea sp. WAO TaxID=406341 RepID=UPI0009FA5752|nr:toll/interleukin-1 receptor domain-containing protein [Bosea sp. WAO]